MYPITLDCQTTFRKVQVDVTKTNIDYFGCFKNTVSGFSQCQNYIRILLGGDRLLLTIINMFRGSGLFESLRSVL